MVAPGNFLILTSRVLDISLYLSLYLSPFIKLYICICVCKKRIIKNTSFIGLHIFSFHKLSSDKTKIGNALLKKAINVNLLFKIKEYRC